jgi:AraC-like DNA-binding protein
MKKQLSTTDAISRKYSKGTPGNVARARYFYYATSPNSKEGLAIVCGGYEECQPDFCVARNKYPYNFIVYTTEGRGHLQLNSKKFELKKGVLSGCLSGTPHIYQSDAKYPMKQIFVTFLGNESFDLFKKSHLLHHGAIELNRPDMALNILNTILKIATNKPRYAQEICCNYLRLLLLQASSAIVLHEKVQSETTYEECRTYIDANFSKIVLPSEAAEACCISVRYMSALFKAHMNLTPHEYILRLKLNQAALLLLTSHFSVKEIAHLTGFNDQFHFSRSFKKIYGSSPQTYRTIHIMKKNV